MPRIAQIRGCGGTRTCRRPPQKRLDVRFAMRDNPAVVSKPAERSEVIREVNAAILSAAKRLHPHGSETWDFYCECDRVDCAQVVRLTLEEHTAVRNAEQPVLAEGHVAALDALDRAAPGTVLTVNLGTGRGYSVLELVEAFERVNGVKVPRRFVDRRPGDIAVCYADASLAKKALGWQAKRGIEEMCRDAWRWQRTNPNGFE